MRLRKKSLFSLFAFLVIVTVFSVLNYNLRAVSFKRSPRETPAPPTIPPEERTLNKIFENYKNSNDSNIDTLADELIVYCDNRTETREFYQDHVTHSYSNGRSDVTTSKTDVSLSLSTLGSADSTRTLLTLFTTIKDARNRICIHINTFRNWQLLIPYIKPVLILTVRDSLYSTLAQRFGWHVLRASKMIHNIPVLRHMFYDVGKAFDSLFYGYANADILFDSKLVHTILVIKRYLHKINNTMIIGQRTNYPTRLNEALFTFEHVSTASVKGKLFQLNAEDYFITTKQGFPWNIVPDYVVGRPGYDNCVVYIGVREKMAVIDTTKTVLALHQSGKGGDFTGFQNADVGVNWKMWRACDIMLGHINCAKLETERDFRGEIFMRNRASTCKPSRRRRKSKRQGRN